ncbi:hypothetical protein GCM10011579_093220 [Streptomyces albiflavescens]|uniref:Probable transposase IS891/IS1136/IS1341 domain-containing protein n=1 Tax=Streptomyces albiflavescens TaxID=1623582 RepID=A0A917YG23_9ACTN|nr:transposase [Streptomyces albiflavescens]GGN94075.1 hypothetical protein GCM10011579_093220 [Streptomyces albiflavescens]
MAFTASPEHLARLALYRKGESDLLFRDGMWFLNATCEDPEQQRQADAEEFLGIDLGIVNIATTSDGQIMAGRALNRGRARERTLRTGLQRKNTPSAKRRLNKRRRKEARLPVRTGQEQTPRPGPDRPRRAPPRVNRLAPA